MNISQSGSARKIILSIIAIIIIVIAGVIYFTQGIADVAREQLQAIASGNLTKAYSLTSKAFQQATPPDAFKKYIDSYAVLKKYKSIHFDERRINNGVGFLSGVIEGSDGSKMTVEYQLVKENDQWKIQILKLARVGIVADQKNPETAAATVATPAAPAPAAVTGDDKILHDILISDAATADGYVETTKTSVPASAQTIYVTAQVTAKETGKKITATLEYLPTGFKIGPSVGEINKTGNILKAFSFTRGTENWQTGNYKVTINIEGSETKTADIEVK